MFNSLPILNDFLVLFQFLRITILIIVLQKSISSKPKQHYEHSLVLTFLQYTPFITKLLKKKPEPADVPAFEIFVSFSPLLFDVLEGVPLL